MQREIFANCVYLSAAGLMLGLLYLSAPAKHYEIKSMILPWSPMNPVTPVPVEGVSVINQTSPRDSYQVLGMVNGETHYQVMNEQTVQAFVQNARQQAGAMGANALLVTSFGVNHEMSTYVLQGKALRYSEPVVNTLLPQLGHVF